MSVLKVLSVFVVALCLAACSQATKNSAELSQGGGAAKAVATEEAAAVNVEQEIARITEKLKTEPTVKGWLLVGDAHMHLKKYNDAVEAYREAYILSNYANEPRSKLKRAMYFSSLEPGNTDLDKQ